jgi:hypothetical protein
VCTIHHVTKNPNKLWRSYLHIFILWFQVTEPPFRALDEWDVYLDAVNRSDVYKEMIRVALEQVTNLFVIQLLFSRIFSPDFHSVSTYPVRMAPNP